MQEEKKKKREKDVNVGAQVRKLRFARRQFLILNTGGPVETIQNTYLHLDIAAVAGSILQIVLP